MRTKRRIIYAISMGAVFLLSAIILLTTQNNENGAEDRYANDEIAHISGNEQKSPVAPQTITSPESPSHAFDVDVTDLFQQSINDAHRAIGRETHLRGLAAIDLEFFSKWEMSESQRDEAPTHMLLSHFIHSSLTAFFDIYDDPNLGIERTLRSCKTLQAFVERSDIVAGAETFYNTFPYSPENMTEEDHAYLASARSNMAKSDHLPYLEDPENERALIIARRSLLLHRTDRLVMFPSIFDRFKGHEACILRCLVGRFKKIDAVRSKYGDDSFSAASSTAYHLSIALLGQLDPNASTHADSLDFASDTWERDHYRYVEGFI